MRRVVSGTLKTKGYRRPTVLPTSLNTGKARGALLDQGERVIGCLWRDRQQRGPQFLNLWQHALVGTQLHIAVGTPCPAIEGHHDRTLQEPRGERHRQREIGILLTHLDTLLCQSGASQGFQFSLHADDDLGRQGGLPSCDKSCQLLLQAHGSPGFCCHTTPLLPSTGETKTRQSALPSRSSHSQTKTPTVQ